MNELVKISYENERPTVLGRDLHEALEIQTPYHIWFPRMCEYGFEESRDFSTLYKIVQRADGTEMPKNKQDHQLSIDMAKEICMIQRSEIGKKCREYFLEIERQWNTPEAVMSRALKFANARLEAITQQNQQLQEAVKDQALLIDEMKPKVLFADAVETSKQSILIGDFAKILKQNGYNFGQNRLFDFLRNNGFLIKAWNASRNMPTQKSMELGLFEVKERTVNNPDGSIRLTKTTKMTGKGQIYFMNGFASGKFQI